jgi:hypothetical protein
LGDTPEGDRRPKLLEGEVAKKPGDLVGVRAKNREGEVGDCAENEGERGRGMMGERRGAGSETRDVGGSISRVSFFRSGDAGVMRVSNRAWLLWLGGWEELEEAEAAVAVLVVVVVAALCSSLMFSFSSSQQ